jgi:hypothetical protein
MALSAGVVTGRGAWKSIRHAAAVPRLQPRRPRVTRLPLAMAQMADSGKPVVRMQKSGPPFEHGRWPMSMATDTLFQRVVIPSSSPNSRRATFISVDLASARSGSTVIWKLTSIFRSGDVACLLRTFV